MWEYFLKFTHKVWSYSASRGKWRCGTALQYLCSSLNRGLSVFSRLHRLSQVNWTRVCFAPCSFECALQCEPKQPHRDQFEEEKGPNERWSGLFTPWTRSTLDSNQPHDNLLTCWSMKKNENEKVGTYQPYLIWGRNIDNSHQSFIWTHESWISNHVPHERQQVFIWFQWSDDSLD